MVRLRAQRVVYAQPCRYWGIFLGVSFVYGFPRLAAAGWRRPGRAVRRPRFHDDDAMPDVDTVGAWLEEPDAPIGGPRTSVAC